MTTTRLSAEDLEAFLDSLGRLLADHCTEADVRRIMDARAGHDPVLWRRLSEMGLPGLLVSPSHGGLGAGLPALERAMELLGASLCPSPILSSVMAASLLAALDDPSVAARLLPGIAAGETVPALALTGPAGNWKADGVAVAATPAGNGWQLDGVARFVLDATEAGLLLVVARTGAGFGLFEVAPDAPGLTAARLPAFDRTLSLAELHFGAVPAVNLSGGVDVWPLVERALDVGRVALAGEQAGGAQRVFAFTLDYARARHQFGRAIGSFQAIKHMAADLLLETESAISAARHAAEALEDGRDDAGAAVSLAAFACADAYVRTTADAVQMHGGIAFTWVHPAHLYLRRARADAQLLGSAAAMRERLVCQLGG